MCGIPEAMAALQIMQAVGGFQAQKAQAKAQEEANEVTRENANIAYLNDLQAIEKEKGFAAREKVLADFEASQANMRDKHKALNMDLGNPIAIMRSFGADRDLQFVKTLNEFNFDMYKAQTQATNSYATLQRTYNKIPPVTKPSALGLGLQIATAGAGYLSVDASKRKFFTDYGIGADSPFNPNKTQPIIGTNPKV